MAVTAFAGVGQRDRRNRFLFRLPQQTMFSYAQTAQHLFVGEE